MRSLPAIPALIALLAVLTWLSQQLANLAYVAGGQAGDLVYAANFERPAPDLDLYAGRMSASLEAGELHLRPGAANRLVYAAAGPRLGDLDLEVEARALAGPLDNAFGVIFRLQEPRPLPALAAAGIKVAGASSARSFYLFLISSDGYYQLRRTLTGEQQVVSAWIPSASIRQGLDVRNRLRIIARGAELTFFINGEQVAFCIPDNAADSSTWANGECHAGRMRPVVMDETLLAGRVALAAQSLQQAGVVLAFDNLLVHLPQEGATRA